MAARSTRLRVADAARPFTPHHVDLALTRAQKLCNAMARVGIEPTTPRFSASLGVFERLRPSRFSLLIAVSDISAIRDFRLFADGALTWC